MAMRQLVTGADACAPSDGSDAGPANAAAALANQLLGMGNDKTQERLHQVGMCSTSIGTGSVSQSKACVAGIMFASGRCASRAVLPLTYDISAGAAPTVEPAVDHAISARTSAYGFGCGCSQCSC
jgi:hypothetical protein